MRKNQITCNSLQTLQLIYFEYFKFSLIFNYLNLNCVAYGFAIFTKKLTKKKRKMPDIPGFGVIKLPDLYLHT